MARTTTKADIIASITQQNECTKAQAADLLDAIIKALKDTLAAGEDVMITGFENSA